MPETPPKGICPLFLRGVTLEKYGMKTGEGVNDVVEYKLIPKEDIMGEIQKYGQMSDFEPGKKQIDSYPGDQILIVVDRTQKYGETFLICYTEEAREEFMRDMLEKEDALREQLLAEMKAEEERKAAEYARLNVVYEDKPITPRAWSSTTTSETDHEIKVLSHESTRELLSTEISRPKRFTKQAYRFNDRNADVGGVAEFRAQKDPNFRAIKEADRGIQVAASTKSASAQTTYYRKVNKSIQYEAMKNPATTSSSGTNTTSTGVGNSSLEDQYNDILLAFLEKATIRIEEALQQNESVDIFHETFRLLADDEEGTESSQAENELREVRNFADANYSKSKALAAIDWMPKTQGMVAVSAVRNISFDQRIPILGQTHTSYVMLWDFRLLVKPLVLMQSHHEIFTFKFNPTNPHLLVGGCITGQVLLWELGEAINTALRKNNRGSSSAGGAPGAAGGDDLDEMELLPVMPKYVSAVDFSHKKCVADLFWLPPTTQINYRGQIVGEEHLDGQSYQFITVAGDGMIMVWDTRYERIYADELRHIARVKHVPTEKTSTKGQQQGEGGAAGVKPLWAPIFKAHLKRLEGVGELSLCKVSPTANPKTSSLTVGKASFPGDHRSQFMIATEEGDIIFSDLSARKNDTSTNAAAAAKEEAEDFDDTEISCVKWITSDHPRPSVHMEESPFFPQIVLTVSDWNFHIWKLGEDKPLFSSPLSSAYLTAGAWSKTRPAVLFVASADGNILVWDFTDSSFHPSIELKAAHAKITSLELLTSSATARHQLLAVGDEMGTLHIFEMPRNLIKPVHKEESIMLKFLERELQRIELGKSTEEGEALVGADRAANAAASARPLTSTAVANDTRPTTGAANAAAGGADAASTLDSAQAALKKEEDDFLKLESIFISELGLDPSQLPSFLAK